MRKSSDLYVFKRKIKKSLKNNYKTVLFLSLTIAIGCFALLKAFPTLKYNITPFFRVTEIEFKNVFYNNTDELNLVIEPYKGKMFWDIEKVKLEKDLCNISWVEYVKISSVPSSKITVIVKEKQPSVIFRSKKGEFFIVDNKGNIITPFTTEFAYRSFPIVTCDKKDLLFVVKKLEKLKENFYETFYSRLSQVVINNIDDKWVCFVKGVNGRIYVEPFGFFQNVESFLKLENMISHKFKNVDYIDLSIKKQIIVKERE